MGFEYDWDFFKQASYLYVKSWLVLICLPFLRRTIWSSWLSFINPGTIFANSMICLIRLVSFWAAASHNCSWGWKKNVSMLKNMLKFLFRLKDKAKNDSMGKILLKLPFRFWFKTNNCTNEEELIKFALEPQIKNFHFLPKSEKQSRELRQF